MKRQLQEWLLSEGNKVIMQKTINRLWTVYTTSLDIGEPPNYLGFNLSKQQALAIVSDVLQSDVCERI